jgi:heptosyltransferase I
MADDRTVPTDLSGKRIAIVMMSAIGDVVHVLPVISSLRAAAPDLHITWVIQPGPWGLVAGNPAVDEFIIFDRKRGWRAFRDLWRVIRGKRYDLVLTLQVYLKAGLITAMLKAPRKIGFDRLRARDANWLFTGERIPPRGFQHVQDQYFEFLEYLGIEPRLAWAGLGSTAEEAARYEGILPPTCRPRVGLILGTSKAEKDWAPERYAELVDRLHEELGVDAVLLGAPSARERAAADLVLERARHRPLDLLAWDLRRLVYLLERVDVLVSPDTGPMHIGVALGTPTVGLLGYSSPKWCGPYRYQDLMVDAFGDPGEDYPPGRLFRPGRMGRITVDQVVERVALALERYPRSVSGQPAP